MSITKTSTIHLINGSSSFSFLPTGDPFEWIHDSIMLNAFRGNPISGSPSNLYLRIYQKDEITTYPLIGCLSKSNVAVNRDSTALHFCGAAGCLRYEVIFRLTPYGIWFYDITLSGQCEKADVIYSQDIGVASKGSVLTNELYTAQYLGHRIFEGDNGYLICSRQNMSQDGSNPYLQQGSIGIKTIAYTTDGTQFFGLSYRKTNTPAALSGDLPSINKQFELSHTAQQTASFAVDECIRFSFYGLAKSNHPQAIENAAYKDELLQAFHEQTNCCWNETEDALAASASREGFAEFHYPPFASPDWDAATLSQYFPDRLLEEYEDGKLLSFFTPEKEHVVLQEKELRSERPHGHILMTNIDLNEVPRGVVSTTNYMYGIFNTQFVAGNTNLNKALSNHRGLLNHDKASGQRIYINIDGKYRLLTMPAAYKMAVSESTWYYQIGNDTLVVTSFAAYNRPEMVLKAYSVNNISYDFLITSQFIGGPNEYDFDCKLSTQGDVITILPSSAAPSFSVYPELHFSMKVPAGSEVDFSFFTTVKINEKATFEIVLQGKEDASTLPFKNSYDASAEKKCYCSYYKHLLQNFSLTCSVDKNHTADKINTILYWYAHNAMIHFASPHGLEQSGGAAWGTRDVCQGPLEFFLTCQHFTMVRSILLHVFRHQMEGSWEWPQWFMFDRYNMHQEDCHGDVIFWPLKAISDYILSTGDDDLLHEAVDYRNASANCIQKAEPILIHIKHAVDSVKLRFLPGTFLISYAGGDWDDTLQPANEKLKENLVSAWTQLLAAETFRLLSSAVSKVDSSFSKELLELSEEMEQAFSKYLIKDNVIAGFLYYKQDNDLKYMLHPLDRETSIQYRLLPFTRSIISQVADRVQAEKNVALIDAHLACPDGVRLMNHPAGYDGGVSKIFLRAEQAANVGREVSLQYVHAHIRYIEAMAALGHADRAWNALMQINPILLSERVPNAMLRQSNVYFSSSDGCFTDRYEYAKDFQKLRDGSISVKGGWRLYSSGPGIYIRRVIADLLGIRFCADGIKIDPVVTTDLDNASFTLSCYGKDVTFVYAFGSGTHKEVQVACGGKVIPAKICCSKYRSGGIIIEKDTFLDAIKECAEICIIL